MKILFAVHQFFPKHYTGTERLVLNLSKQMQKMGHYVEVLTYGIAESDGFKPDGKFLVKNYQFQNVPVISIRHDQIPEEVSFTIYDRELEEVLTKIISPKRFDIVHVFHPMRVGSVMRAAKNWNIPLIISPTDFWLMCPKGIAVTQKGELCNSSEKGVRCVKECYGVAWQDRLSNRFNESLEVFKSADSIVSGTRFLRQILEGNDFTTGIKIIGFGEDYGNVRPSLKTYSEKSEITLGFMSTLVPHKGAHILLDAYNSAKRDNIKLKIYGHYFGEIEYYDMLKGKASDQARIEFCGEYRYEDIPKILDGIDVLVVPSIWWENSPLVLLSALAHGVPAIVSNLGGLTEVVKEGENGFSFSSGNAESLADILRKIGDNPTILNKMKNGLTHPPRVEEAAFEYEKIYLETIRQRSEEK